MSAYLLDTDHFIKILEGDPLLGRRLAELSYASIVTCVIVQGELLFGADQSDQKETNLERVNDLLAKTSIHLADPEAARVYGKLKASLFDRFGPRQRAKRRRATLETLGFGENDLWIAAIAMRYKCTLVSSDSDFQRIAEVEDLSVENWWSFGEDHPG